MKKNILISCLVLIVLLTVTGCGNAEETKKSESIKFGGTSAVTTGIDPAKDWNGWYTVEYGVGETLFKLDKNLKPIPWLAEKYERKDEFTWIIKLNDKAKFSNGEKVDAEKVIKSLKRAGENNDRAISLKTSDFVAKDGNIVIKTKEPYVTMINDLCDPYSTIIDVDNTKDYSNAPIGTGPFVVKDFEPSKHIKLEKNKNYWDGSVKSEKIEYINVADFNTLAMSLKSGEIDIALDLNPEASSTLENEKNIDIIKTVQPRTYQLYFNLEKITDKAVREAVMYGIDKKTVGDKQLKGAVKPSIGAFLEDTPFSDKNLKGKEYNVEKAKNILKDGGYSENKDGLMEKNGKTLELKLSIYKRLAMENIATELQAQLKKIGIKLEILTSEKSTYFEPGEFEIGMYSIVTTPTGDPYNFLRDCMTNGGKANYGHYNNTEVDKLVEKLKSEFDLKKRTDIVDKIQQTAIDDAAFDYIGFNIMSVGINKDVKGYNTHPNDYYQVTKDLTK